MGTPGIADSILHPLLTAQYSGLTYLQNTGKITTNNVELYHVAQLKHFPKLSPLDNDILTLYIYSDRTQWDSMHRILVGDGDSILCTKLFVGSGPVSLHLSRGRHGRLPPLLVATSCGDAGSLGLLACALEGDRRMLSYGIKKRCS